MAVTIERIDDEPEADGARVLVDRLWPRGVSKEMADRDAWINGVAPSEELRTWYDHDPDHWCEVRERYREEHGDSDDAVRRVLEVPDGDRLTLLYAASDREHNTAVVLQSFLEERLS